MSKSQLSKSQPGILFLNSLSGNYKTECSQQITPECNSGQTKHVWDELLSEVYFPPLTEEGKQMSEVKATVFQKLSELNPNLSTHTAKMDYIPKGGLCLP